MNIVKVVYNGEVKLVTEELFQDLFIESIMQGRELIYEPCYIHESKSSFEMEV